MSNPERDLGSREKRLAEMVPRLSEALKEAALLLDLTAELVERVAKKNGGAVGIRAFVRELDRLILEADRI